jgi:gliding motility-associated protein GldM
MINMMYLVLTAMLALNVSKEVLDSFAHMDAGLVRSEQVQHRRAEEIHRTFEEDAGRLPEKYGAKQKQALQVRSMADELVRELAWIKAEAMAAADGLEVSTLSGTDASGRDTVRALLALEAKDDRSTLTRMLVGSDPGRPRSGKGSARDLKEGIARYRDTLITHAAGATELQEALRQLFDLADRRDASGTMNTWEAFNFYDVPLAAGIATLSKLQADVRHAENDLVRWLHRSVDANDHKFGTLTTAVVPQSNFIMQGDSFRADVFLAAYDALNPPEVRLAGGTPLPVGVDGKAKLRISGDRVGEQVVEGVLRFMGPHGMEEFPYRTQFQVMPPVLVASPVKMNVLYRGVLNPIDISVPGVPADRVQAVTTNGRIVRQGSGWAIDELAPGIAEVSALVTLPDGGSRRIGPLRFRVKELPPPTGSVAGRRSTDNTVRRQDLTAALGITAVPEDALFEDQFSVTRFELTVVRRDGSTATFPATGNRFTPEMRTALNAVRPNERVIFENIRAQLATGKGREVQLPQIALRVLQ